MGQTLSHGVYLPNEGERNCYAGLASNWQILNTAVGAIAEKAPLVHTHTVSQITDFPAYGTTAGTICEGNDSRLSDARTPVAHTHTKSDVTNLFNSANVWSGENSFTAPCKTLGKKLLTDITDLDDAYYNGEVCGFNPNTLHNPTGDYGNVLTINNAVNIPDNIYSSWITQIASNASSGYLGVRNRTNGDAWTSWNRILTEDHAVPTVTNTHDLGTSDKKWKTLNGINPGALSLPDYDSADPINFSQWDVTGAVGVNYYTPTVNGWLNISIFDRVTNSIFVYRSGYERVGVFGNGSMASDGRIALLMPVKANATYTIIIKANANSDIYSANFFPCLGNV